MKKKIIIIGLIVLVLASSLIVGYKVLNDKEPTKIMDVKANEYLSQDEEEVTKVVEEVLEEEKIKKIEDKNTKINKTIQTVLKRYNGKMNAEQIKQIVIKKIG